MLHQTKNLIDFRLAVVVHLNLKLKRCLNSIQNGIYGYFTT